MLSFLLKYGYYGLFVACFLSSTLLPFSSEFILAGCIAMGLEAVLCLILATISNTLGGLLAYYIGYLGKLEWAAKYMHVKQDKIYKTQKMFNKKGAYIAFFSFLPLIGDIIPLMLGLVRASFYKTVLAMMSGKFLRYYFIIFVSRMV